LEGVFSLAATSKEEPVEQKQKLTQREAHSKAKIKPFSEKHHRKDGTV
jgi:hypothetical protein